MQQGCGGLQRPSTMCPSTFASCPTTPPALLQQHGQRSLTLGVYLQEDPVHLLAQAAKDAGVQITEAVQHPGLLIVSQVLDGQVVA